MTVSRRCRHALLGVCCNSPLLGRKGGDEKMRYSEQFMEHIEYAFAAFCRVVLRNAALKQLRKEWLKSEHEEQEADTL